MPPSLINPEFVAALFKLHDEITRLRNLEPYQVNRVEYGASLIKIEELDALCNLDSAFYGNWLRHMPRPT